MGKSTIAVNLAVALAQSGARVGLLDADILGPNIPLMMGLEHMPPPKDKKLVPPEAFGVKVMSFDMDPQLKDSPCGAKADQPPRA